MDENRYCPNGHAVSLSARTCPICHTLLPSHNLDLPSQPLLPTVPGYEILEVLGSGGMGIVYKARQEKVNGRLVSLKMIRALQLLEAEDQARLLARFRMEAAAVADLNHPHIQQIYDVGEHLGHPYLALEYIDGSTLAHQLGNRPQPVAEAAALAETLARTVQYAHQKGIVHRDLKPLNVLVTSEGMPKVSDFGLVKRLGEPGATEAGEVLGSAPYMAPEQFRGKPEDVGPAVDVYALGVILYEMLTGRPPFLGRDVLEVRDQVLNRDPVAPRRLGVDVPPDLETICLKCLHKEAPRRYASAHELAEDVRRFRNHEPIIGRPVGYLERAAKFAKRRKATAGLIALSVLAPLTLLIVVLIYNRYLSQALYDVQERKKEADTNAKTAHANARESNRRLARQFLGNAARALDSDDHFGALLWCAEARDLEREDATADALHRTRLAAILRQCPKLTQLWHHKDEVLHAEFSPDGRRVVTAGLDNVARVWDVAAGTEITPQPLEHKGAVLHAAFSPDGQRIVTASRDGTARVWDATTGRPQTPPLCYIGGQVIYAAFSPDGRRVVTAGGPEWQLPWARAAGLHLPPGPNDDRSAVRVWDAVTGKPLTPPLAQDGFVHHVAFSADGQRLATASGDGTARVWNVATGQPLGPPFKHPQPVYHAVFAPNGKTLLTAGGDSHTGWAQLWLLDAPAPPPANKEEPAGPRPLAVLKHDALVARAVFSPDGSRVLTASWDRTARLWDPTRTPALLTLPHLDMVKDAVFSPNGLQVATASGDPEQGAGVARVWDASSGQPLTPALRHGAAWPGFFVASVRFSPDGRRLLTAADDHTARLWDLVSGLPRVLYLGGGSLGGNLFSSERAPAWDHLGQAGRRLHLRPMNAHVHPVQVSSDGLRAVVVNRDGSASLWDLSMGRPVASVPRHVGEIYHVAFSADGQRFVTAGSGKSAAHGETRVWEAATGRPLSGPLESEGPLQFATLSSDGSRGVTVSRRPDQEESVIRVWETAGRQWLKDPLRHPGQVWVAAFSPDGRRLLTAGSDRTARIWDVDVRDQGAMGLPSRTLGKSILQMQHQGPIHHAAYSPDGQRLVTAGDDRVAEVWDTATGQRVTPPLRHQHAVTFAAFSADGQRLVTASEDTARVWNARTGEPITPPLKHRGTVLHAAFHPDGRLLATTAAIPPHGTRSLGGGTELLTEKRVNGLTGVVLLREPLQGAGEARVWDSNTGEPVTPSLAHPFPVYQAAFVVSTFYSEIMGDAPALISLARSSFGTNEVRGWNLVASHRSAEELRQLGQVLAGRRLDPSRELVPIEAAELRAAWQALRADHPMDFTGSPKELLGWHEHQADACEHNQLWKEALTHLDPLIAAHPSRWFLCFRRASARERLGQWKETIADCSLALQQHETYGPVWSLRASAHCRLHQWPEGIADCTRAIGLDANDRFAWHLRGFAQANLGRWPEALKDLDQTLALPTKQPPTDLSEVGLHGDRALLRLYLGDRAGYRADCAALRKVLDRLAGVEIGDPDPEAARLLLWVYTLAPGTVADFGPLIALARKGVRAYPDDNCPLHHTLGAILYRADRLDEAAERLRRAMVIHGRSSEVPLENGSPRDWLFLAMIHHRQGRSVEARKWLDKAVLALAPIVHLSWQDRLEFQVLRREAEALLGQR